MTSDESLICVTHYDQLFAIHQDMVAGAQLAPASRFDQTIDAHSATLDQHLRLSTCRRHLRQLQKLLKLDRLFHSAAPSLLSYSLLSLLHYTVRLNVRTLNQVLRNAKRVNTTTQSQRFRLPLPKSAARIPSTA